MIYGENKAKINNLFISQLRKNKIEKDKINSKTIFSLCYQVNVGKDQNLREKYKDLYCFLHSILII